MMRNPLIALAAAAVSLGGLAAIADSSENGQNLLENLQNVEELQSKFNADQGKPRLLLLLSPTCPMCVNGASWVRENVLKKYPEEDVTVYAVWFNMIPGDRKERWDSSLLDDARVKNYWDEDRVVGKWVSKNVEDCEHLGPIDWDSYYLFDGTGRWNETLENIQACGTPIYKTTDRFAEAVARLFESDKEPGGS